MIPDIIMEFKININSEYWSKQEEIITDFQEYFNLQFISKYTSKQFCKTTCRYLFLGEEEYIQQLV